MKTKKGMFIVYDKNILNNKTGVNKKILSQIDVFNENGLSCIIKTVDYKVGTIYKVLSRLPFSNVYPKWKYDSSYDGFDFIYLRRPEVLTYSLIRFLKKIKKNNPNTKILYEIPTFPYDLEIKARKRDYIFYLKDVFNRRFLKKCIDRIPILTESDELWGIKTLKISNGIDLTQYNTRELEKHDSINLLAVAFYMNYHGYERLINGLYLYYKMNHTVEVNLYFVGIGETLDEYKKLVNKYCLNEHVFFEGRKSGKELDYYYNIADAGLCSFGAYKKNIDYSRELKSREYAAKGLPIISGVHIDLFDNDYPAYLEFPNNDQVVDINKIVDFLNEDYDTKKQIALKIREFAENNVGMHCAMRTVIEYVQNE